MDNDKLQAALIAGPAFGVAIHIPFVSYANFFCCALYIGGGVLASYLFFRGKAPFAKPYAEGAVTGLWAGLFGGTVDAVLDLALRILGVGAATAAENLAAMEQETGFDMPQFLASMMGAGPLTPGVAILMVARSLVTFCVLGTIGGVLGAAFFRNKEQDL